VNGGTCSTLPFGAEPSSSACTDRDSLWAASSACQLRELTMRLTRTSQDVRAEVSSMLIARRPRAAG
jgi:hypothetical protein